MDQNWRTSFPTHILERGVRYYRHGLVGPLRQEGNRVRTVVSGSRPYPVELVLRDGAVAGMQCGCPYALGGSACKHMAAALLALEDGQPVQGTAPAEGGVEAAVSPQAAEAADRARRIAQWRRFLEMRVLPLVERGPLTKAFLLTGTVLLDAAEEAAQDPSGGAGNLERACLTLLTEIVGKAAPGQRMEMYRWLEETRSRPETGAGAKRLLEVQLRAFHEPVLLRRNLALLDRLEQAAPERAGACAALRRQLLRELREAEGPL